MANKNMVTKVFPSFTKSMDAETGIVEAYVSIMGIRDLDSPPDVIQLGAFVKSIQERGPLGTRKIRVLRQHWPDEVVGLPLALVEHPRDMLPPALLEQYPEATGGLFARTQFVMDTQLGRETYALYKAGAMDEWSIGFDPLQFEYVKDDEDTTLRILKEIRLWEYSPVTWGMNPGTMTTGVKAGHDQDDDAKDGPTSHEVGTGAEPHERALTREMAMKLKQIEIDLALQKTRSRRLK